MKEVAKKRHRVKKMRWLRTQKDLVDLVLFLSQARWIDELKDYAAVIAECFVDKDGKPFKNSQLRSVRHDIRLKVSEGMLKLQGRISEKC